MSRLERVLEPDSTETPECICGKDMVLESVRSHSIAEGAELRDYSCECGHRLRLAAWKDAA